METSPVAHAHRPLRCPIVLVHGLAGFDQLRIELLSRYPICIEYFRGIPEILKAAGAPEVHTVSLPPHGCVEERARALRDRIRERFGDRRVHLIAHSMGGLDSRFYLTHLGGHRQVVSLTTLGTPHRGSALACLTADAIVGTVERLIGRLGMRDAVDRIRAATAAHFDLRPQACERLNRETPDIPGVHYFSWAGRPGPGEMTWALLLTGRLLQSGEDGGENDGLVTVRSARWSGWRGTVPADHFGLVGWQFSAAQRHAFDVAAFYRTVLRDIVATEA